MKRANAPELWPGAAATEGLLNRLLDTTVSGLYPLPPPRYVVRSASGVALAYCQTFDVASRIYHVIADTEAKVARAKRLARATMVTSADLQPPCHQDVKSHDCLTGETREPTTVQEPTNGD